jgi:hypothetical protein
MNRFKTKLIIAAVLSLGLMLSAACGGGDDKVKGSDTVMSFGDAHVTADQYSDQLRSSSPDEIKQICLVFENVSNGDGADLIAQQGQGSALSSSHAELVRLIKVIKDECGNQSAVVHPADPDAGAASAERGGNAAPATNDAEDDSAVLHLKGQDIMVRDFKAYLWHDPESDRNEPDVQATCKVLANASDNDALRVLTSNGLHFITGDDPIPGATPRPNQVPNIDTQIQVVRLLKGACKDIFS